MLVVPKSNANNYVDKSFAVLVPNSGNFLPAKFKFSYSINVFKSDMKFKKPNKKQTNSKRIYLSNIFRHKIVLVFLVIVN